MVDYGIEGKIAAVTGAGKGIGRETAIQLAKQGATVFLIGRSMTSLGPVEKEIKEFSEKVYSIECDVACEEDAERAVNTIIEKCGRIDIFVNNAGIEADREPGQMGGDLLMTTSIEQYHKVLDTNLIGHYNFLRRVIPHMQKKPFRPHRQRQLRHRIQRRRRHGGVRGLEGGHHRPDKELRPPIRPRQHHHQQCMPRDDRHADAFHNAKRAI